MHKHTKQVLSGLLLWSLAGTAAAEDAHIYSMSYSTQPIYGYDVINVYSSDGVEWDTLDGPPLKFGALMNIDTRWPGYVQTMGVLNGYCVDAGCAPNPTILADHSVLGRDLHWSRTLEIAMEDIPLSDAGGIATIPLGDQVLQICNEHLTGNGATVLHTFNHDVTTSWSVNTRKGIRMVGTEYSENEQDYNGGDETRQASFEAQVRCNPHIFYGELATPPVEEVELFLATFSNAVTHPDVFRTCKQGRILVRVTTAYPGPVEFFLWTELDGLIKDELIETWSADVGSGVYEAEVERWVSVSETTLLEAMAVVDYAGPAGMSSGWKSLNLQCNTGADDFLGGPPPSNRP